MNTDRQTLSKTKTRGPSKKASLIFTKMNEETNNTNQILNAIDKLRVADGSYCHLTLDKVESIITSITRHTSKRVRKKTRTLPEQARARATDPETSKEAAKTPNLLTKKVYQVLKNAGNSGLAEFEVSECLGKERTSISPRFAVLRKHGWVFDSGVRRRNPDTNRSCIVWIAI